MLGYLLTTILSFFLLAEAKQLYRLKQRETPDGWMEVSVMPALPREEQPANYVPQILTLTPLQHSNTSDEASAEFKHHGVDVTEYPVYKLTLTIGSETKDLSRKAGVELMAGVFKVGPDWGGVAVQNSVFQSEVGMEALHVLLNLAIVRSAEKFYGLAYGLTGSLDNLLEQSRRRMYFSSPALDKEGSLQVFEFALAMGHKGGLGPFLPGGWGKFPNVANPAIFGKQFEVAKRLDPKAETVVFESKSLSSVEVSALPPKNKSELPKYLDILRYMLSKNWFSPGDEQLEKNQVLSFGSSFGEDPTKFIVPVFRTWAKAALQILEKNQVDGLGWGVDLEAQQACPKTFSSWGGGVGPRVAPIKWDRTAAITPSWWQIGADHKYVGCKQPPTEKTLFMTISGGTVPYLHLRLNKYELPEVFPCHRGGKSVFTDWNNINIWGVFTDVTHRTVE